MIITWCLCAFVVIWAMAGYPVFLQILDKFRRDPSLKKNYDYTPTVTILVVAHNEDRVIWNKLNNLISVEYPK